MLSSVFRKFEFEAETYVSLACVPLAIRRKLDLAGLKISLAGWQSLPYAERLALCHLPVDGPGDLEAYRTILRAFAERAGATLTPLPELLPTAWSADAVPRRLQERLSDLRRELHLATWQKLDEETRYCLWKYAASKDDPSKVAVLFEEVVASCAKRA